MSHSTRGQFPKSPVYKNKNKDEKEKFVTTCLGGNPAVTFSLPEREARVFCFANSTHPSAVYDPSRLVPFHGSTFRPSLLFLFLWLICYDSMCKEYCSQSQCLATQSIHTGHLHLVSTQRRPSPPNALILLARGSTFAAFPRKRVYLSPAL